MSSLVIPAASVFEMWCRKTDTQTNGDENHTPAIADGMSNNYLTD